MPSPRRRRCNTVGLLIAGLSIAAIFHQSTNHVAPDTPGPAADGAPSASSRTWSLRGGGWVIRVDGAEVELPSLGQQTRPVMRPRGPQPLSPYDQLIAYHAEAEGLDWRLIAAVIFEESRFAADAVSDAGAVGLMQVRPIAAAAVGSRAFAAPNDNIRTGARYLRHLSEEFRESTGRDRLGLVLAAYNMGPSHVHDAQMLARRVGYEPNIWHESMALVLPLLQHAPLCERLPKGCARGRDTVAYVRRILQRYDEYRGRFGTRAADLDEGDEDGDADDPLPDPVQAASASG